MNKIVLNNYKVVSKAKKKIKNNNNYYSDEYINK